MPDSDQTDSNDDSVDASSEPARPRVQPSDDDSAVASNLPQSAVGVRFCGWLGVSLVLAILLGVVFSALPTRFRLLGLLGIAQGFAVGAVIGPAAKSFRVHLSMLAAVGGFIAGAASVVVTSILWWQSWAEKLEQSAKPRPDAAIAARMLAQMKEPDGADPEQLKAYEESRRQFAEFIDAEAAPPEGDFAAWLTHRASLLETGPTAAIALGLLELLLASAASSLLACRAANSPFCAKCQTWRRAVRTHAFAAPLPEPLKAAVSRSELEAVTVATIELSACDCQQHPLVNLQLLSRNAVRRLPDIEVSEQQFSELKRLLDEAQGMN